MAAQRSVWSCWDVPERSSPAMHTILPCSRLVVGIVLPLFVAIPFLAAMVNGKVVWERGRHLGPLNYHCLAGPACMLFGLCGLLAAAALAMRGWCFGREPDAHRDHINYGLVAAAAICFVASLFVDAAIKGG